eukprot:s5800_g1.t1
MQHMPAPTATDGSATAALARANGRGRVCAVEEIAGEGVERLQKAMDMPPAPKAESVQRTTGSGHVHDGAQRRREAKQALQHREAARCLHSLTQQQQSEYQQHFWQWEQQNMALCAENQHLLDTLRQRHQEMQMLQATLHEAGRVNVAAVDKAQLFDDEYKKLKKQYEDLQDAYISQTDELQQLRQRQGDELEQLRLKSAARERDPEKTLNEKQAEIDAFGQRMHDARDGWKIATDLRIATMAKSNQEEQRRLLDMYQKEKERTAIAHTVNELICFAFFCRI